MVTPINKIIKNVKNGKLEIAQWENTAKTEKGTEFTTHSYTIQKSYTKDGKKWETTNSLNTNELQTILFMIIEILQKNGEEK